MVTNISQNVSPNETSVTSPKINLLTNIGYKIQYVMQVARCKAVASEIQGA